MQHKTRFHDVVNCVHEMITIATALLICVFACCLVFDDDTLVSVFPYFFHQITSVKALMRLVVLSLFVTVCVRHSIIWSPTKMWSLNDKVGSPKWENEESNFWHTYSFTFKRMANS